MSRAIEWLLLGGFGCGAILAGLWRHRPAQARPWLLLAGGVAGMGAGDVFFALDRMSLAQGCYLLMYALIASALWQFTRGGTLLRDRSRLIDVLAFTCAVLLSVWVFVIGGTGDLGDISAADVMGSLLLIGVTVRLILATGRNLSAMLLLIGSVGLLAGDIMYPLMPTAVGEIGFVVFYLAWGSAGLHPSMARLTQPMPSRPTPWHGGRAVLLCASVATPPIVLLIEALTGEVRDGLAIAAAAAITLTLTITRLADSVSLSSRALARERALRSASADLVSAADLPAVDQAVRAAVDALVPAPALHRVRLASDDRQLAAESLPPAPPDRRTRSWWTDESPGGSTLVCPLWLEPLAVARPSGGALVLTGRREVLTAAQDSLEVLAGQAALALDRISLVEAVSRRDSDLYLRAVISNTADLMLVLDDDQRIRYASPALHDLLSDEQLSPLATLADLVHPDDRSQIRRALTAGGDGTMFYALRRPDHSQTLVKATYRDLREDRLVQGFVITMSDVTDSHDPVEQVPHRESIDDLPAWLNRRSAQHKFRY